MRAASIIYVAVAIAAPVFGQTKGDTASVEKTLTQMEREWAQAAMKKDAATVDRILADDWSGIDYQGNAQTKSTALADLKSGQMTLSTMEMGDLKVRVFGSAAVVIGSDTEKSTLKGQDSSGKYLWMDVFAMRNGRWQAVASEVTKVAK